MTARGLIIAAPHSGAGKTTVTLAILAALRRRGLAVRAAKAGPDYIDPAFHAAAIGMPSVNLDSWAMPGHLLDALAGQASRGADILVIEGVMGLFDGAPGTTGRRGATAELAAHFGIPVVLVLDVSRQAQSAAALVRGFAAHDPAVQIAGVILNRVASERHRALVTDAIEALGISVLGAVPREAELALPERHLGLVQAGEHADLGQLINRLVAMAQSHIDLNAILISAASLALDSRVSNQSPALPPPGQRVALASDQAFSFIYPHVMDAWRGAGTEIIPFSPLADEPPPERADSCWLPGGYPELHAEKLAAADRFLSGLRHFAQTRPIHGECGGYMVLGEVLEDATGKAHAMAGLLGHSTSFAKRKLHLGYRTARLLDNGVLGARGTIVRGHEFHYATLTAAGNDETFADIHDAEGKPLGKAGGRRGNVSGTFFHAIAATND
ncbi:MAG TPA: cobyrinate a,c-diamide synthase [Xanthobacteraceae bacterium]|jgi:cobyrinic acid a,c-diamide synthase|nr:cobyrinate a,c-diamide synthase [Xanthobacteraceae bacterium]